MELSHKLGMAGGAMLCFSVIFGYFGLDEITKFGVRDQTALRKRNQVRGIYLKLPFPLSFSIYFFNVSNPDDVQNGAKPKLKEIGPFVYDLWKEKIDVVDNNIDDSLTYTPFDIYKYNQKKSGALTDDTYVTILHPLIIGVASQVARDSPALLPIVNKAIGPIFQEPKNIYLTAKVRDILFDGIIVNCKVKEFAAKAVCTQLKQQVPGLVQTKEKGVFLFSVLGPRNATNGKRFKVHKGLKNSKDTGRMLELDGEKDMGIWGTKICNRFDGTDGWIFPPLLKKEEGVHTYSSDLCRNIILDYIKDTETSGLKVREYNADLGDMDHNKADKCYCPKTCLKKGIFDLTKCMGVPILATLPHFLRVDERYMQDVEGLEPVEDKHLVKIYMEPLTSTPIKAYKRLQFNLPIAPIEKLNLMKNVPEALHPLFWVEESVELEGPLLSMLQNIFLVLKLSGGIKYIGMLAGTGLAGAGAYLHLKNKKDFKITNIKPKSGEVKEGLDNKSYEKDENVENEPAKVDLNKLSGSVKHIMSGHELDRY